MSAPGFTLRPAGPADDAAIGELLVAAFLEQYSKKMPEVVITGERKGELRAVAEKRAVAKVWVAEAAGRVVGTVSLWPPGAKGSEAWKPNAADLRHLGVSASHRGAGVSKALLDTAEGEGFRLGADFICLHVRRGAAGVRGLYEARGYLPDPGGDLDLPSVYLEALFLPRR